MAFTIEDSLKLECLQGTRILAGHGGIDKEIRFVNVMEVPDIVDWIHENELLLTTAYPFQNMEGQLVQFMISLKKAKIAALGIKTNRYIDEIPLEILNMGNQLDIPILELSSDAKFDLIIRDILIEITNRDYIGWIKYIENIAGPALAILSLWLIYVLVKGNSFGEFLAAELNNRLHFWAAVTANLSYWVTVAVNISDFTRYVKVENPEGTFFERNKVSIMGQIPGITIGMILFISVGMIGKYYSGYGNPVDMISNTLGGYFMLLGLIIILLAQLSTNVAANLYAPGNILSDIFGEKLSFAKAVIIAGGIGMLTFPWYLLDHFLTYLPLIGAFLSPLPGIMIIDYYLIRKTNLDLIHFRDSTGKFEYNKGFNPAALITYVIAGVVGIIFLEYSWLVSLPTASIIYYFLMINWINKKYPENL